MKELIVLVQHQGQNWLPLITRANVRDDLDCLRFPRGHEESNPDCRSIRAGMILSGSAQHKEQEVVEAASCGLTLAFESGGWFDVPVKEGSGDDGIHLEPDSPGSIGDINENSVLDCLLPCIRINKIPFVIGGHLLDPVLEWLEGHRV